MVLLGREGGRIRLLASTESLLLEKSIAWFWRPTGDGKGGGIPVGVVGVVDPFPYRDGNPSRLLLETWWSKFGDLRSNIALS